MVKISQKDKIIYDLTLKSLISNELKVIFHNNSNLIGLTGIIINETSSFFEIKTKENQEKKILKNSLVFEVEILGKKYQINAEILKNSLSQRIKKFK